jgi:hypothetical protein
VGEIVIMGLWHGWSSDGVRNGTLLPNRHERERNGRTHSYAVIHTSAERGADGNLLQVTSKRLKVINK